MIHKKYKYLESPIIFMGFGRSGTTIISNIVFEHPKLAWVSNYQNKFPGSKTINLLRNLQDNSFWKFNRRNKSASYSRFMFLPAESYTFWNHITKKDFGRNFFWMQSEDELNGEIRFFCNAIVKFQRRERFSFKITGPSRLEYLHSIFPDAKYVWY